LYTLLSFVKDIRLSQIARYRAGLRRSHAFKPENQLLFQRRSAYRNNSAICNIQHFPDISAPVAVEAIKNHQAQFSFMHKVCSFESSGLLEIDNNGHIISCIISPYRGNKTLWVLNANDLALN